MRPESGRMVWWKVLGAVSWQIGYVTYVDGDLIRLGRYNGDTTGGIVLNPRAIEWKYHA